MKKLYVAFALLCYCATGWSQITITQNDMPHPGDTTRLTSAQINLLLNYAATGPNHNWNFANLRTNTQLLDSPMSVSATNFIYGLFYSNFGFNPNRASVAYHGASLAVNPLIPLTNPYSFYYLNSSRYEQVGLGADLLNFPTPIAFNNHDIIYHLPINYGNADTSHSDWGFGLNNIGYIGYTQTRINVVDGWGTLTTPHGTYNVLRVKTTRAQKDTVAVDSLNLNLGLDRPLVTEYKWLANGETVPVMQVTTQTLFGIEVITEILFIDDFLRIETQPLASNVVCAGSTITVPYTKYGTFNGPGLFSQGNRFRAQLSDANGSFANPIVIGSVTSTASGTITATIPGGILPGTHYRIRVIGTDPAVEGSDNGADITIEIPVVTAINAAGPLTFCEPGQVELLADSGAGYSYQWLLNGNAVNGANMPNYFAAQTGQYSVAVSNSCGTVTTPALNVTADPLPAAVLNNAPVLLCSNATATLTAQVSNAVSMQWQLNGTDIPGETADSIVVSQAGTYTLNVSNNCGTATSAAVAVTTGSVPSASINNLSGVLCPNSQVILQATVTGALSVQWQLNGLDLPGETADSLVATQAGNYQLIATNDCGSVNTATVTLTAGVLPGVSMLSPTSQVLCPGSQLVLNTAVTDALGIQWQLNGVDIGGAVSDSLTVTQPGNYTLIATNDCGSVTSAAVSVAAGQLPSATATASQTGFCQSDSALLTASATNATGYQWQLNGVDIPGAINSSYYASANGSYTVVVTNNCGSAASPGISITVNPAPAQPVITMSQGLLTSTAAVSYQWYLNGNPVNGATAMTYLPLQDGIYTVMITDANGCTSLSTPFEVLGTGIAQHDPSSMVSVYPNPSAGELFVRLGSHGTGRVTILDLTGRVIAESAAGSLLKLDISHLPAGSYNVRVISEGAAQYFRVIRQ